MEYENFSPEIRAGIDNFRKSLPKILEDVTPIHNRYCDYSSGGPFEEFVFKNKEIKWTPSICLVFASFCLAAGASFIDAHNAVKFASSKNFWLGPMELLRIWYAGTDKVFYEKDCSTGKVLKDLRCCKDARCKNCREVAFKNEK